MNLHPAALSSERSRHGGATANHPQLDVWRLGAILAGYWRKRTRFGEMYQIVVAKRF